MAIEVGFHSEHREADRNAEVVAAICVIDRQEGARQLIEGAGVRFESLFTKADMGIDE